MRMGKIVPKVFTLVKVCSEVRKECLFDLAHEKEEQGGLADTCRLSVIKIQLDFGTAE